MDLKSPEISVLVVNYYQDRELQKLVRQLSYFLKGITYEVLVFDNSMTCSASKNYQLYSVNKNVGYATAINYLSENAAGNYLFITNPDVSYKGNLVDLFTKFKLKPVFYGVMSLGKKEMLYKAPLVNFFNKQVRFSSYAFLIHKDIYKSVGGFSNEYFMYFEDNELALALNNFKVKTYFVKKPLASHDKTYTNVRFSQRKVFYYKSLLNYLFKHNKLLYLLYYFPLKLLLIFSKIWLRIG